METFGCDHKPLKGLATKYMKLIITLLAFAGMACAQFDTAEVLGSLKDPAGAGVPKATVTLINQSTSVETKATSDSSGSYDFFNVKVGRYTVTVEATGFSK